MKARLQLVFRVLAGCAALSVLGCSEETAPAQPGSFDRPTRLTFACFDLADTENPQPTRLEACRPNDDRTRSTNVLHALVVQSSRGEVAAVDLQTRRTLDSRADIPGYTFLPAGELPAAIVVPPEHPKLTYVANAGSRDITVIKTRAFRKQAATDRTTLQTVSLPGGANNAPLDMVLAPDEDALFVSQPDSGQLLRLPIQRCDGAAVSADPTEDDQPPAGACLEGFIDTEAITVVPLATSLARVTAPTAALPELEGYLRECTISAPSSAPVAPLALPADVDQRVSRPSGLAIDAFCERDRSCPRRLLVADATLPLIHVVDLDALAVPAGSDPEAAILAPILTGAPTRGVVATPRVPTAVEADAPETHFVYAIDATDGSVIVTQDGELLQVGMSGARPDRITFGPSRTTSSPVASSLNVLTPEFDELGPAGQWAEPVNEDARLPEAGDGRNFCLDELHPVRDNRRLRGVFLGVGMSDGSVRIVDVHDMNLLNCREPQCSDDPYPVVRHRPRIIVTAASNQRELESLTPQASPSFRLAGDVVPVRVNGATSDPRVDGLDCVPCTEGLGRAFPDQATADVLADAGVASPGVAAPDAAVPDAADAAADGGEANGAVVDSAVADPEPDGDSVPTDSCSGSQARVCALSDPWAELDQWEAIYEGAIPGSGGGQGRFAEPGSPLNVTGALEFLGELPFCALGVLGTADLANGHKGDQLTLVGSLPPRDAIDQAPPAADPDFIDGCRALLRARDEDRTPIAFEIREAYDDRLVIEPQLRALPTGIDDTFPSGRDVELVNKCFGDMLMTFEVRSLETYTVLGLNSAGFLHRVKRDEASGRCVLDQTVDARRTGRAYGGERFDNGQIAFQIRDSRLEQDSALSVALAAVTPKALMDATSAAGAIVAVVPADLRWSDIDGRLYLIDTTARGLLTIPVDPFPTSVPTSIR